MKEVIQIRTIQDVHGNVYDIYDYMTKNSCGIWKSTSVFFDLEDAVYWHPNVKIVNKSSINNKIVWEEKDAIADYRNTKKLKSFKKSCTNCKFSSENYFDGMVCNVKGKPLGFVGLYAITKYLVANKCKYYRYYK